jgi:hypothetical protein
MNKRAAIIQSTLRLLKEAAHMNPISRWARVMWSVTFATALMVASPGAQATVIISLDDGTYSLTVADGSALDSSAAVGVVT